MKVLSTRLFATSTGVTSANLCHLEAWRSPRDPRRWFGLECCLHGYLTKICGWPWVLVSVVTLAVQQSLAQGCASCYTTTAAGGTQTIHALRFGILILLIPPILMFASLVWILWRWRKIRETNDRETSFARLNHSSNPPKMPEDVELVR